MLKIIYCRNKVEIWKHQLTCLLTTVYYSSLNTLKTHLPWQNVRQVNLCISQLVFNFSNLQNWFSIDLDFYFHFTVCRRWEDLLEPRFEKFTELLLCDLTLCRTRRQGKICQIYRSDDFQTLMQHIGLNVTSVMLGVWEQNYFAYVICVRSQYEDFIYSMKYDFTPQDFIEILPKTCQNMSVLRITSSFKHDIQLTTNWVQELLENCRDLKALVLSKH